MERKLRMRLRASNYKKIPYVPPPKRRAKDNFAPWLDGARRAAVLVPLTMKNGEIYVILTVRSPRLNKHGGEVAFPGGMRDEHEKTPRETALRESFEEIGLGVEDVEVISYFVPWLSRFKTLLFPVIGLVHENFNACSVNHTEVADVFMLPLSRFLSKINHSSTEYNGYFLHFFTDNIFQKEFVTYGITASICIHIAMIVYERKPEFPLRHPLELVDYKNPTSYRERHFLHVSKVIMADSDESYSFLPKSKL